MGFVPTDFVKWRNRDFVLWQFVLVRAEQTLRAESLAPPARPLGLSGERPTLSGAFLTLRNQAAVW
jgi:hypothetical protein